MHKHCFYNIREDTGKIVYCLVEGTSDFYGLVLFVFGTRILKLYFSQTQLSHLTLYSKDIHWTKNCKKLTLRQHIWRTQITTFVVFISVLFE